MQTGVADPTFHTLRKRPVCYRMNKYRVRLRTLRGRNVPAALHFKVELLRLFSDPTTAFTDHTETLMANLFQMARTVALSCAFALPAGLSLADAKKVYWQDLMVAAEPIENPFAKLETEQLQRLARLLRYETEQPGVLDVEIKE